MGGAFSQEMHILTDVGEDELHVCQKCNHSINSELNPTGHVSNCSNCGSESIVKTNSIEVAHLFLLGDTYSKPFEAKFRDTSESSKHLYMGCYGFGVTRTLATAIECLSTDTDIRWPLQIAPYLVTVIPPKAGSRESSATNLAHQIAERISEIPCFRSNVTYDDRTNLTIGGRMKDLVAAGFPYLVVVGKSAMESIPKFEVLDVYRQETHFLTHAETIEFFEKLERVFNNLCSQ